MRTELALLFSIIAFVGCGTGPSDGEALTPAVGKRDSLDAADRSCAIVLRDLGQPDGMPGHTVNGTHWVVFEGHLDVATDVQGTPAVLVQSVGIADWREVSASPVQGAPAGFQRYRFTLDDETVPMGDNASWREMRIEVAPFVRLANGARLFDHNRRPGDLDNYALTAGASRIEDEPAICH